MPNKYIGMRQRGTARPAAHRAASVLGLVCLVAVAPPLAASRACAGVVRARGGFILQLSARSTEADERALAAAGADIYRRLPLIHSVAASIPTRDLKRVRSLPFVRHVSPDLNVHKTDQFTVASSGADVAWSRYGDTGAGVTVAVVDSGVAGHPDLGGRLVASVDMTGALVPGGDGCGHGTHVSGIIAGNGARSTGPSYTRTFYGIAPGAKIVSVRVLDGTGNGSVSNVIAGIQWAVAHARQYGIRVLNLSLGHTVGESYSVDPLCQAVEQAWKAGIVVVCAAGNDGRQNLIKLAGMSNEGYGTAYGTIESPGNDPYVITVGAMKSIDNVRADDRIATYSSRGPSRIDFVLKPDVVAAGNKVISLDTAGAGQISLLDTEDAATNEVPDSYYIRYGLPLLSLDYIQLSGTSMATPVVAGAAALMLQHDPTLTPDTIKARLMVAADKWTFPGGAGDPCTFGAGYLNIPAALQCAVKPASSALSPTVTISGSGSVSVVPDAGLLGGLGLWGSGVSDLRGIWGSGGMQGSNGGILSSSSFLLGSSVWSDRGIWGSAFMGADLSGIVIFGE